jgi:AraC-like DNA-binding protein
VSPDTAVLHDAPAVALERRFDALSATRLAAGSHTLPASAAGHFRVLFVSSGRAVVRLPQDRVVLTDRELLVVPPADAAWVATDDDSTVLSLRFEASAILLEPRQMDAIAGHALPTDRGTASLLAHVLDALLAQLENYQPANPVRLQQHLGGFLAMAFVERADLVEAADPLLGRAKEHIESCLGDLSLRPDSVAAAINVSTRTLNRLFEAGGISVSSWIRQRRLERCREALADPRSARLTISAIGSQWGMWDAAHFSRSFKSAYGVSPRDFRRAVLRRDAVAVAGLA